MNILSHPDKLLSEHLVNVAAHSKRIIESKNLKLNISTEDLAEISYLIGLFHDFGKLTTDFQNYLTKKPFDERRKKHSLISAILGYQCVLNFCQKRNISEKYAILAALTIKRHHGNLDNIANLFNIDSVEKTILEEQLEDILRTKGYAIYVKLLKEVDFDIDLEERLCLIKANINSFLKNVDSTIFSIFYENESLEDFLVEEILYSVLIDSDKKDAADLLSQDFDIHKLEIKENAVETFIQLQCQENPEKFDPDDEQEKQLVTLKKKVFDQCVNNPVLSAETKIYSITAPTGIGKTYTSFATALKLKLKIKEKIGKDFKIYYVLPFTTIIDQNYDEFHKILEHSCPDFIKRENDYLIKHHYLAADDKKDNSPYLKKMSETNNKHYESKSYFDDLLFIKSWDAKVVVSTYVQLMHTIIGGKNSFMNKFHNIVNSIIILDEVQCISLKYWELMKSLTVLLAEKFNVYFIFLTATQPLIFNNKEIQELSDLSVFEDKLMDRVKIVDRRKEEITVDKLYSTFQKEELDNLQNRYIFILNTKRSSFELYNLFKKDKSQYPEHSLFYLSTNLTKNDRDKKLDKIIGKKNKESKQKKESLKKFILITTQLVEAGVDISSDVCYRDLAPVDSIIQSAGRVNRFGELKENKGILMLVHLKMINEDGKKYYPSTIYNKNLINWSEESIDEQKPSTSKDFQNLCKSFFQRGYNQDGKTKQHSQELMNEVKKLNFSFIIENFRFISDYPTHSIFILNEDSKPILEEYKKAVHTQYERDDDFRSKWKGELKRIRAGFNKFTIEISPKDFVKQTQIASDIKELGEEFYYVDLIGLSKIERDKIYSQESGFNVDADESAEFL